MSIKGIWRNGINAEILKFEGSNSNEFNQKQLNFKIPEVHLMPEKLPNLTNVNHFKNFAFDNNPSYLNSKDN